MLYFSTNAHKRRYKAMIRWFAVVALGGCDAKPTLPARSSPIQSPDAVAAAGPAVEVGLCHADNWCWTFPRPHGAALNTVVARGPDDIWAAGEAGVVSHWDGKAWRAEVIGAERIDRIWPRAVDDVWAVGANGFVARRNAGGWITIPMPEQVDLYDGRGLAGDDVWFVGRARAAYHWDGEAIARVALGDYNLNLAVLPLAPDDVWIGGYPITRWNGTKWSADRTFGLTMVTDLWAASPAQVWAVDDGGSIARWGGKSWSVASDRGMIAYGSDSDDTNLIYASTLTREGKDKTAHTYGGSRFSGTADDLWVTGGDKLAQWDGKRWHDRGRLPNPMRASTRVGAEIVAVGSGGAIKRRLAGDWTDDVAGPGFKFSMHQLDVLLDGTVIGLGDQGMYGDGVLARYDGRKWTRLDYRGPSLDLVARAADDIHTCGHGGVLQHFDGTSWSKVVVGTGAWRSMWIGTGTGWAVGEAGTIARWDGKTWIAVASPTTAYLNGVWGSGPTAAWAIGVESGVGVVLRWDGKAWDIASRLPDEEPHQLAGVDDARVWMATSKQLLAWNGTAWEPAPGWNEGGSASRVHAVAADDVWVTSGGVISHFDSKRWTRASVPAPVRGFAADKQRVWLAIGDHGLIVKRR